MKSHTESCLKCGLALVAMRLHCLLRSWRRCIYNMQTSKAGQLWKKVSPEVHLADTQKEFLKFLVIKSMTTCALRQECIVYSGFQLLRRLGVFILQPLQSQFYHYAKSQLLILV